MRRVVFIAVFLMLCGGAILFPRAVAISSASLDAGTVPTETPTPNGTIPTPDGGGTVPTISPDPTDDGGGTIPTPSATDDGGGTIPIPTPVETEIPTSVPTATPDDGGTIPPRPTATSISGTGHAHGGGHAYSRGYPSHARSNRRTDSDTPAIATAHADDYA